MQTAPAPDGPAPDGSAPDDPAARGRIALNRHRQRELYGSPLGDRVRRLTATLGITQARLARTLGVSPAMLSQLASARRVKIGDPAVLARLHLLDQRCATAPPRGRTAVEELLDEVGRARLQWAAPDGEPARGTPGPSPVGPGPAGMALRAVAPPARLAAAAATLAVTFPELAEVLRQAACGAGTGAAPARASGPRRAPRRHW
jgi:transcriptional regulator with XRE-family HTH domain